MLTLTPTPTPTPKPKPKPKPKLQPELKPTLKVQGLHELRFLRDTLQQRARQAAEQAARDQQALARAESQRRLFTDSVGRVTPLPRHNRVSLNGPPPSAEPRQRELDEKAALAEALSDEVDIESLLLTDDGLSFQRPGLGPDVVTRLRRGHWATQGELDLHGLRRDAARESLSAFMREAALRGWRCLRIVHGKGHGSPGREPVLKAKVHRWLGQHHSVLAFTQASGPQGGAGALLVLLRGTRRGRQRGKVGAEAWADTACEGAAATVGVGAGKLSERLQRPCFSNQNTTLPTKAMLPEMTADAAVTAPAAVNSARQASPPQPWKPPR